MPALLISALAVLSGCDRNGSDLEGLRDGRLRIPDEEAAPPEPAPSGSYDAAYLTGHADFINWVRAAALNQLKVRQKWHARIGTAGMNHLHDDLAAAGNDAAVRTVIRKHGIDTVETDGWMAEHIVFGLALKQGNEWLFRLSDMQRNSTLREALFAGLTSTDERWVALRAEVQSAVDAQSPALAEYRIDAYDVWECTYSTLVAAVKSAAAFATLVDAVNSGNWSATVAAAKEMLRGARRWGWVGLAWAAIEIGTCLWGRY